MIMKNKYLLGLMLIAGVLIAATQSDNIYILNSGNNDVKFRVRTDAGQTAPLMEFVVGGTAVFGLNSNGVMTVSNPLAQRTALGLGTVATNNVGVTTNFNVRFGDGTTNQLQFSMGILTNVVAQ